MNFYSKLKSSPINRVMSHLYTVTHTTQHKQGIYTYKIKKIYTKITKQIDPFPTQSPLSISHLNLQPIHTQTPPIHTPTLYPTPPCPLTKNGYSHSYSPPFSPSLSSSLLSQQPLLRQISGEAPITPQPSLTTFPAAPATLTDSLDCCFLFIIQEIGTYCTLGLMGLIRRG